MSDQPAVRMRLIGQMQARTPTGDNVLPAGRKTRALLAVVALSAPRPALRSRLAELLWGRRPEEQARASLRQEIHRLLETLAPAGIGILQVTRDHISLRPGAVWADVDEVMRATAEQPASLALLDGDLLEDLDGIEPSFDAWLSIERERLRDRGRTVAEALLREQMEPEPAIQAAQRLLQIDRAHEGAWRAMMRAHVARGERGMAIQAYDRCRAVLAELLDAAPSAETQQLLAEIRGPSGSHAPSALPPSVVETRVEPEQQEAPPPRGTYVGVMPLQLVGTTEVEAALAPGLAEQITTALARFRWMFVIAPTSLARFAAGSRDEAIIRRALGIDFLLDGLIQLVGSHMRISMRLLDLRAGHQVVWARQFNRAADDLLSLQDEVAAEVAAQVDQVVLQIEARRSTSQLTGNVSAHDMILRSIAPIGRLEVGPFMRAGEDLARAIVLEPESAAACAWSAYWQMFLVSQDWAHDRAAAVETAGRNAERAIMLDPFDAPGLTIAGHVRASLQCRPHEALSLHERALSLNPNLAMAWALSGAAHAYIGDQDEAQRRMERYKQLTPLDPHACFFEAALVLIHLLKRDYEAAVTVGRAVSDMNPAFSAPYKPYLAALGHLGRGQEAVLVRRRLMAIEPNFCVADCLATSPLACATDRDLYAQGLHLAGVAERSHHAVDAGTGRETQSVS